MRIFFLELYEECAFKIYMLPTHLKNGPCNKVIVLICYMEEIQITITCHSNVYGSNLKVPFSVI